MEQIRSNGEQKELRDEIVDLGTRYGIVTPYTSYLALENEAVSTGIVAPPPRAGAGTGSFSSLMRADSAARAKAPAPVGVTSGAEAIQLSRQSRDQQELARLKDGDTRTDAVRRAAGKTFYLIDGVWTDSEFKAESRLPETALSFGSDEYFALIGQFPKLGSYFALAERVVVVFEGRVYRVNAAAP